MPKKATAPRQWARDQEKESFWRDKLAQWLSSGLSVRAFCRRQQVPESSFNAWRREIMIRDRESLVNDGVSTELSRQSIPATVKDSRGRLIPTKFREAQSSQQVVSDSPASPFVPLQIVHSTPHDSAVLQKSITQLDIVTPAGFTVRVTSDADVSFIAKIIQTLEK